MREWINWRSAIGSVILGVVFAAALFYSTDADISLSGLDLFFAITTAVSLGFNLWQLIRDRYKYHPIKSSLIGLFNDIKARQLRVHLRHKFLASPGAMNAPIDVLRAEFADFVQEILQSYEQLREHVVANIHMVDPNASNHQVFRAADFGLTEQEKTFRSEFMDQSLHSTGHLPRV